MRKKLTRKQRLQKQADKLWQEVVVLMHPYCEYCGGDTEVGHHMILKSQSNALRYDLENGVGMCGEHHCLIHANDYDASFLIVKGRGSNWYEKLLEKKKKGVHTDTKFYEDAVKRLQKELNKQLNV